MAELRFNSGESDLRASVLQRHTTLVPPALALLRFPLAFITLGFQSPRSYHSLHPGASPVSVLSLLSPRCPSWAGAEFYTLLAKRQILESNLALLP